MIGNVQNGLSARLWGVPARIHSHEMVNRTKLASVPAPRVAQATRPIAPHDLEVVTLVWRWV